MSSVLRNAWLRVFGGRDGRGFLCIDCGADTDEIGEYYSLHDDVWARVAKPDAGMLCVGCVERRLGRELRSEDFTGDEINWNRRDDPKSDRLSRRMGGAA